VVRVAPVVQAVEVSQVKAPLTQAVRSARCQANSTAPTQPS